MAQIRSPMHRVLGIASSFLIVGLLAISGMASVRPV